MIRITLRRDDDELGVVYAETKEEIPEILESLNCELVSVRPSSQSQMSTERMLALGGLSMREIAECDPLGPTGMN